MPYYVQTRGKDITRERPSYANLHQKKKVTTIAKSDIMENVSTLRRREAVGIRERNLVSEEKGINRRPGRIKNDKDVKMDDEVEQLIEMWKRVNILEKEVHNIKVKRDAGNRELKAANDELQELKVSMENLEKRVKRNNMKTENGEIVEIEDSAESENKVKTLEEENRILKGKIKRRDAELKRMNSQKASHSQESSTSKDERPSQSKDHRTSNDKEQKPSHSRDSKEGKGASSKSAVEEGCSIQ